MNKKQFAFILCGIWGIVSWILALFVKDAQVEYVAGLFGLGLEIAGFCVGVYLFFVIIAFGIIAIYKELRDN